MDGCTCDARVQVACSQSKKLGALFAWTPFMKPAGISTNKKTLWKSCRKDVGYTSSDNNIRQVSVCSTQLTTDGISYLQSKAIKSTVSCHIPFINWKLWTRSKIARPVLGTIVFWLNVVSAELWPRSLIEFNGVIKCIDVLIWARLNADLHGITWFIHSHEEHFSTQMYTVHVSTLVYTTVKATVHTSVHVNIYDSYWNKYSRSIVLRLLTDKPPRRIIWCITHLLSTVYNNVWIGAQGQLHIFLFIHLFIIQVIKSSTNVHMNYHVNDRN
jgi:hypothetical protein